MTPDEQLQYEERIAKIIQIRRPLQSEDTLLKVWLNSSALTALIGVIGTAIIGTILTGRIQDRIKQAELEREDRRARVTAQEQPVTKALNLAGTFLSTSDDLLVSIHSAYSETGRPKHEIELLRTWKTELAQKRDAADFAWRREERLLGYSLVYVFNGDPGVRQGWQKIIGSIRSFEACTNQFYSAHAASGTEKFVEDICAGERSEADRALEIFLKSVDQAQRAAPTGDGK